MIHNYKMSNMDMEINMQEDILSATEDDILKWANKKLNKGGTMTYAGWCNKHNFDYCKISDGIPTHWYDATI